MSTSYYGLSAPWRAVVVPGGDIVVFHGSDTAATLHAGDHQAALFKMLCPEPAVAYTYAGPGGVNVTFNGPIPYPETLLVSDFSEFWTVGDLLGTTRRIHVQGESKNG